MSIGTHGRLNALKAGTWLTFLAGGLLTPAPGVIAHCGRTALGRGELPSAEISTLNDLKILSTTIDTDGRESARPRSRRSPCTGLSC